MRINKLKLLAILHGLISLLRLHKDTALVRIMTGNTTAVNCINKLGRTQSVSRNHFTKVIWMVFQKYRCHLSATHMQGKHNILSRVDAKIKMVLLALTRI